VTGRRHGHGHERWVLAVTLAGVSATAFPIVILAASLGRIADDLDSDDRVLAWVIAAPLLVSSLLLPVLGKLGDIFGHRRVFLVGFASASVLAFLTAASWDAASLIVLRTLGQATGAATQPTSFALLLAVYRPDERVKAMGYWSFVSAGAPAIGLVAGGPLVDVVGWRVVFIVQGVLSLVAVVLASLVLRETPRVEQVRLDIAGAAALAVASGGALLALDRAAVWGPDHVGVLVAVVAAGLGVAAFVRAERRAADALLPLDLVTRRGFAAPVTAEFFMQAATMGAFTLAPLMLASEFGYSVTTSALVLIPLPLGMSLLSPVGGRLAMAIGERRSAVAGGVALGAGMAAMAVGAARGMAVPVAVGLGLLGVANGVARPSLAASAANSLDDGYAGVGMAAVRMLSQLGAATGIAVLVMIRDAGSYAPALAAGVLLAVLSTAAGAAVTSMRRRPPVDAELTALTDPYP
jgi:MFS family permease